MPELQPFSDTESDIGVARASQRLKRTKVVVADKALWPDSNSPIDLRQYYFFLLMLPRFIGFVSEFEKLKLSGIFAQYCLANKEGRNAGMMFISNIT